jgi:hypothetical protein
MQREESKLSQKVYGFAMGVLISPLNRLAFASKVI